MSISDVLQFSMAQTVDLDESLVQTLIFVRRVLSPTIKHIYYPWCKKDISVATAFPESVVTHVCRTSSCVQALRANHLRAFCQDPNTYRPKRQQDILMLLDPETMPPIMFQTLADTGIVLASHAGATAEGVYACREAHGLVFSGAVAYRDKEPTYVTDRLEDFWTHVETDEEYRAADKCNRLRDFLKKHTGVAGNFAEAHRELLHVAHRRMIDHLRRRGNIATDYQEGDPAYVDPTDMNTLIPPIPFRRSAPMYVFRRA